MIEWLMIFALGFLTAGLLALALFPAVHARASRLAARRVMVDIPISMAEIGADRDALRAEFAVSMRRLEMRIEELTTKLAEQLAQLGKKSDEVNCLRIELAAREAHISALPASKAPVPDHSRETKPSGLGQPVPPGESLRQSLVESASLT